MWLPVTGFISSETYFIRSDPDTTVTEPANAEGVLTFAGYDARTNSIWYDSGRGYTRTGKVVPDVAAPAVEVSTIDMRGRNSTLTRNQCGGSPGGRSLRPSSGMGGLYSRTHLPWTVLPFNVT